MAGRAVAIALSLALLSIFCFCSQADDVIQFPSGSFNFTSVDTGEKNSGVMPSEDEDDGFIRIGSTGETKGLHLGSAADAIEQIGTVEAKAAAQTLLSQKDFGAMTAQVLATQNATGLSSMMIPQYPFLNYFGGTVMHQRAPSRPFRVYLIYYGKWNSMQMGVINNFVNSLKPQKATKANDRTVDNWWRITTKYYYGANKVPITKDVQLTAVYMDAGSASPRGSQSDPLSDRDIRNIVVNAVAKKFGTPDKRSVYAVMTGPDVYVKDFCQLSCSYHSSFRSKGKTLAYIHVGNSAKQCPYMCTYSGVTPVYTPANDLGADGAVNWLAHSLSGVATNPFQSRKRDPGWVVARNSTIEVSDLCEWDFGFVGFTKKYAQYNLRGKGDMRYLIQRNFNRILKRCVIIGNGKGDEPMPPFPS